MIDPAVSVNDTAHTLEMAKAKPKAQAQGGPGRKRKSRRRPAIKHVKKLSPNINAAIMKLLKS